MSRILQAVREAVVDGRLENVIYRQTQLESLHKALTENVEAIEKAIKNDTGHSNGEIAVEYILTLKALKDYYTTLDADAALEQEYAIARDEDAPKRYQGIGLVYLVPTNHTPFFSVIVGVSAAIAAGNCTVIELRNTLNEVPALLRRLLKSALDSSIIGFVVESASDEDLGPNSIRVFQDGSLLPRSTEPASTNIHSALVSPSSFRTVAVVDRSAHIQEAAEALVAAAFIFGGHSPYAPDLVLVNEFVKDTFVIALMNETTKFSARLGLSKSVDADEVKIIKKIIETDVEKGKVDVLSSNSKASIFDVKDRDSDSLRVKIGGPCLLIQTVRSLDDAIDLANHSYASLASYLFADSKSAKYLAQFIQSQVTFVNQVPLELLVGPAAPRSSCVDRTLRYPIELLSTPYARYVTRSTMDELTRHAILDPNSSGITTKLKDLSVALAPKKPRSDGGQLGFFEQGIFLGLGIFSTPIILSVGTLGYYGVRYSLAHFQFLRS